MKKKLHFRLLLLLTIIITSCTKDETFRNSSSQNSEELQFPKTPLTVEEINSKISETLKNTGDFDWNNVNEHFLWSAAIHGQNVITIGYGNEGQSFSESFDSELENKKNNLIDLILKHEGTPKEKLKLVEHNIITVIDVEVKKIETIIALRKNSNVRYLEPNGYSQFSLDPSKSNAGCAKNGQSINPSHYQTVTPNNAQVAWNFYLHNIPQAWNESTGAGVTIGLIDTGVSASQSLLNSSGFNDGDSSGRTVEKYGTFIDSNWWWSTNTDGPHDKCGHGTAMGSTMAAPRNDNGMPVGVAYNANLIAYRATEDVVLNDYHERKGVSDALVQLGNRNDVKIISMSIGFPWSIGNVKDAVKYAYNKGKLIFAAGGTSTTATNWYGVIFPASMNETVAVTGVDDGSNYTRCDICHSGSKIDFTIIMQGENNTSKAPPVLGFYEGQRRYTGGSSVATATTAGIAALVWSKYPSWSREQVLQRLKESAGLYPNKDSNYGYGDIDALEAVQ